MLGGGLRTITFDRAFAVGAALWALVLVVLLGARLVRSLDDGEESEPAPTVAAPPTTEPPTFDEITAALEIESGFTAGVVVACNTARGQATGWYSPIEARCAPEQRAPIGDSVSYGIVVENTSDQLVRSIELKIQFFDAAGAVVPEPGTAFSDADLGSTTLDVAILRPGERFGIGRMQYVDRPGVASMQVEVLEVHEWMPEDYAADPLTGGSLATGELDMTIGDVAVSYGTTNEPVVSFPAEWEVDEPRSPHAQAVFRNSAGAIIGGSDGSLYRDGWTAGSAAGRWHLDVEFALDDPMEVPGIDPSRTEIYVGDWFP